MLSYCQSVKMLKVARRAQFAKAIDLHTGMRSSGRGFLANGSAIARKAAIYLRFFGHGTSDLFW